MAKSNIPGYDDMTPMEAMDDIAANLLRQRICNQILHKLYSERTLPKELWRYKELHFLVGDGMRNPWEWIENALTQYEAIRNLGYDIPSDVPNINKCHFIIKLGLEMEPYTGEDGKVTITNEKAREIIESIEIYPD